MATFGRSVAGVVLRPTMQTQEVARAYREYARPVLRRCRRILRHQHAAEDVVQEVFLRLWRYGDSFRHAECKLGWLYRVADRCCYNELRRRNNRRESPADDAPGATPASHAAEDRELVLQFLSRFDERVQKVAILHYVDEMTHDEIAALTGWSRQTIHKKLQCLRARAAALRGRLLGEPTGD
jgi:RNA polymerase sigma-70 factor, ECF subfamily